MAEERTAGEDGRGLGALWTNGVWTDNELGGRPFWGLKSVRIDSTYGARGVSWDVTGAAASAPGAMVGDGAMAASSLL